MSRTFCVFHLEWSSTPRYLVVSGQIQFHMSFALLYNRVIEAKQRITPFLVISLIRPGNLTQANGLQCRRLTATSQRWL